MGSKLKQNGQPRAPRTRAERVASIRAFGLTMAGDPSPAPAPSFLSTFFEPDAETARRWEIVKAAR